MTSSKVTHAGTSTYLQYIWHTNTQRQHSSQWRQSCCALRKRVCNVCIMSNTRQGVGSCNTCFCKMEFKCNPFDIAPLADIYIACHWHYTLIVFSYFHTSFDWRKKKVTYVFATWLHIYQHQCFTDLHNISVETVFAMYCTYFRPELTSTKRVSVWINSPISPCKMEFHFFHSNVAYHLVYIRVDIMIFDLEQNKMQCVTTRPHGTNCCEHNNSQQVFVP